MHPAYISSKYVFNNYIGDQWPRKLEISEEL